jgi:hypothetical protein
MTKTCQWVHAVYDAHNPHGIDDSRYEYEKMSTVMDWWTYCPYCGKPIEVVEPENDNEQRRTYDHHHPTV